jgi:hypothetical protein
MTLRVEMDRLADNSVRPAGSNACEHSQALRHREQDLRLEVQDLTPELRNQFGYPGSISGVLVRAVDVEGPAYEKGLREGMLVLQVGKQKVSTIREFRDALVGRFVWNGSILFLVRAPYQGNRFIVIEPRSWCQIKADTGKDGEVLVSGN